MELEVNFFLFVNKNLMTSINTFQSLKFPNQLKLFYFILGNENYLKVSINGTSSIFLIPNFVSIQLNEEHILLNYKYKTDRKLKNFQLFYLFIQRYFLNFEKIYKKKLIIKGLGFKAFLSENKKILTLKLGLAIQLTFISLKILM
jgi:ribosomal protein L6P/L9E